MKRAAIGIRTHSGWGAVVTVSGSVASFEVIHRRRIAITAPDVKGSNQPYHFAQGLKLSQAEAYLADCAVASERLALEGLCAVVEDLRRREYVAGCCAMLLASGRSLPPLPEILTSHPLIHTAEGEFFRAAFRKASERLGIQVTGIRERELISRAEDVFGKDTIQLQKQLAAAGRSLGPPWTTDQKTASIAAFMVLASERKQSPQEAF